GNTLATAILDDRRATVLSLWDPAGGRRLRRWEAHKGEVYALAFSPDGKRLASASIEGENRLRVWAVPTGERQLELSGAFVLLRFSPDGKILATAAPEIGAVSLREVVTWKEVHRIRRGGSNSLCAFRPAIKWPAM